MLGEGKFKHSVPDPTGEELETFQTVRIRLERTHVEAGDEHEKESMVVIHRKIGKEVHEEMKRELECEISERVVNLEALQKIAGSGQLDGEFRALVWKLLLGYLPPEKDDWERELAANRSRYAELKKELLINPSESCREEDEKMSSSEQQVGLLCRHEISNGDHPLNMGKTSIWCRYFKDAEILEQIDRDLPRTHPDMKFFSGDSSLGKSNQKAMKDILFLFAKLNPAIGYVQGMNEVLAPLYFVCRTDFDEQNAPNVEADCFACFVRLMFDSVNHFCQQLDNSSMGIHSTLHQLSELLRTNDQELWQHLMITCKLNPQFYAFRWITLLLTQEFDFDCIIRLWDSLLSNPLGVQELLLRVCCAMLLYLRHELLTGDFTSNLKLLQHYPQVDLERLLNLAHQITPIHVGRRI
ncbi:TBC domain-containing protein C1952.17c-like [Dioscorea cayenensis subsp. rotundata]|uniref:TBC domain-containing protein C1952.17c-like n=1 Tax=Dioscorea cayennensis subsp. rotundata TaxID=55577 RepID=A0AB40CRD8_DIOCR|nr:TBC domain-containing protein C1952.17c-like [Dioscorea cayenensis subsp. rotundata]